MYRKPKYGTKIDWSNPLTKGLIGSWLLNEGGGNNCVNAVTKQLNAGSGGLSWSGDYCKFDGVDGNFLTDAVDSWDNTIPYSYEAIFMAVDLTGGVFGKTDWEGYLGYHNSVGTRYFWFQRFSNAGGDSFKLQYSTMEANTWYHVIGTYDASDMKGRLYVNGVLVATSDVVATTFSIKAYTNFSIGNVYSLAYMEGGIKLVRYWKKCLNSQEITSLYANPYQIYYPQFLPYQVFATTIGATTLTINNLISAHTLDNIVLTQKHTLTVDNPTSAQTVDNIPLVQKFTLAPDALAQGETLDNVLLTQKHQLALDNLTDGQTVDNTILTSIYVLQSADLASGQTIGNIELTQQHQLALNNLTNGHELTNIVLELVLLNTLVVQGITSGETLENVILTQIHNLTPQDIANAQYIANVYTLSALLGSGFYIEIDKSRFYV